MFEVENYIFNFRIAEFRNTIFAFRGHPGVGCEHFGRELVLRQLRHQDKGSGHPEQIHPRLRVFDGNGLAYPHRPEKILFRDLFVFR